MSRSQALDLRNNSLASLDPDIVEALPAEGRLWLPNVSLSCDCDNEPGLAALLRRRAVVQDFADLRCAGGAPLRLPRCAGRSLELAAALAPPLLLAALAAALLARRSSRARLKRALRGLGVLPPRAEPADDRPFDVFVSFSHLDSDVVTELLAGLEPRYRVCVHFRDWAPGAWIPAQIAASVRRSRRTLAVVSAHFLRSAWARAEFREAHAAALRDHEPRLVVVLLDEPARLPLDAELRRYLAANTYVRWGDAWFWRKLRAALPPPRAPPPAASPDAAAAPPAPLALEPLTGAAA